MKKYIFGFLEPFAIPDHFGPVINIFCALMPCKVILKQRSVTQSQGTRAVELLSVKCFHGIERSLLSFNMDLESDTEKSQMGNTCRSHSENMTLPLDST